MSSFRPLREGSWARVLRRHPGSSGPPRVGCRERAGERSRSIHPGRSIRGVLHPHTLGSRLFLPPTPLPQRLPACSLHSPEEIKVDGGELALDEGPECPEEVRRLKTSQRRSVW